MTAIVTGATGFIGQNLVKALTASGEDVRCLSSRATLTDRIAGAPTIRADFTRDNLGVTDDVLRGVDTVYHLAAATRAASEAAFRQANVAATERVIDAVATASPQARFVYVSSQAAAGPARDAAHPLTEADSPMPIEAYGRSKLSAEQAVLRRAGAVAVTIVRPVTVYGPGDRDFLAIFRMAKRGVAIYPGIRDSVLNIIHVDDLVRGLMGAARSPTAVGRTYFMGNSSMSWRDVYHTVFAAVGTTPRVELDVPGVMVQGGAVIGDIVGRLTGRPPMLNGSKAALASAKYWLCSSDRAAADFGFAPTISVSDGMRATHEWYRSHRWV
jgi:nucleoside-diphosphate-sugar epimerase